MSPIKDTDLLAFAHSLADSAGAAIRPYFGAHGTVEAKGDNSPVTAADRAAEAAMRCLIEQHYPAHSIYGEEFGIQHSGDVGETSPLAGEATRLSDPLGALSRSGEGAASLAEPHQHAPLPSPPRKGEGTSPASPPSPHYTWVIDPIDGTRAFIEGRKEWGTLIALCENGVPILGVLDQPITGERWVGVKDAVTTYAVTPSNDGVRLAAQNDGPRHKAGVTSQCKTRPCATLAQAEFSTTSASYFTPVQTKHIVALAQACRHTVKDGDCYAYGLLARGQRDIVVDAGLKPYDILALVPIIAGAGGKITGWDGTPVTLTNYANVVAAGDVGLHQEVLDILYASQ